MDDVLRRDGRGGLGACGADRRRGGWADLRPVRGDLPRAHVGARARVVVPATEVGAGLSMGARRGDAAGDPPLLRDEVGQRRRSASALWLRRSATTSGSGSGTRRPAASRARRRRALAWFRVTMEIDIRDVLPAIRVPTLVLHRAGDRVIPVEARTLPRRAHPERPATSSCDGSDHFPFQQGRRADGRRGRGVPDRRRGSSREPDRVLATVLFTDIVGSTERAAELGDRSWTRAPRASTTRSSASELERFRGNEIRIAGRRLPRDLRRPRAGDPVRVRDPRRRARPRDRDPGRAAHRRDRARGDRRRGPRRPPRSTDRGARRCRTRCSSRAR